MPRRRELRHVWLLLLLAGQGSAGILRDAPPTHWIRAEGEIELSVRREFIARSQFRTDFESAPGTAQLELRALGHVRVLLDEQVIFEQLLTAERREQRAVVPLILTAGRHTLRIDVANPYGPAALFARCDALDLASSERWQARAQIEGRAFTAALRLLDYRAPQVALAVPSSWRALARSGVFFALLWFAAWVLLRRPDAAWLRPERLRFAVLGLWCVLGIWNLPRLPAELGFDAPFHLEYIGFLHRRGQLPLASDGWQMFQPPLYFLMATAWYRLLEFALETTAALRGLRVLSLLCGAILIELVYRSLRQVFAERPRLLVAGTLFAGFLPINLYMSQWVGNEPLAGVFGAAALLFCLAVVRTPVSRRMALGLGSLLGLAVLSKVSALLLLPPILGFLLWRARGRFQVVLLALATCGIVCGWFFLRNWLRLGNPLVLSSQDTPWWQAPGYRSWEHLYAFGISLSRPIMAGLHSFGDAVYSTLWLDGQLSSAVGFEALPWRYDFLLACAPLAIVPSLLLLVGVVAAFRRRDARLVLLSSAFLLYFLALLQQYMALPIFSTGKASYTLALLPAYGILTMLGLSVCCRRTPRLEAWLTAYLCAFAAFAYLSYFAA